MLNPNGNGEYITVPCGQCGGCRQNRRADWTFRLKQEQKGAFSSFFITLTYSDENIVYGENLQTLVKSDLQKFVKRFRKENTKHSTLQVRYYAVGEYGTETERPHYHLLLFNAHPDTLDKLETIWGLGNVKIGLVEDASIHYTTKYHVNYDKKDSEKLGREPEFALMSTKPAIGSNYLIANYDLHKNNSQFYVHNNGHKQRLPRYYRDKIFSETEKKGHAILTERKLLRARAAEAKRLSSLKILDPEQYILDREKRLNDNVKSKINEKSKNKI